LLSDSGVMSIPFRLSISVIVLSLSVPICVNCIDSNNLQLSEKIAFSITQNLADTLAEISSKGFGESRIYDISRETKLLDPRVEIIVGDYPAGHFSSIIRCSGPGNWNRSVHIELGIGTVGISSADMSPFIVSKNTGRIRISHEFIDGMDLVILRYQ